MTGDAIRHAFRIALGPIVFDLSDHAVAFDGHAVGRVTAEAGLHEAGEVLSHGTLVVGQRFSIVAELGPRGVEGIEDTLFFLTVTLRAGTGNALGGSAVEEIGHCRKVCAIVGQLHEST